MVPMLLGSCGEYAQLQKSGDIGEKYSYAKKCYNEKKYSRAATLLEEVVPVYSNSSEGAPSLFLLADSYYNMNREADASLTFQQFYKTYPKNAQAEEALYKAGEGLYKVSPDPRLDQTATYDAIKELNSYLENYPTGKYAKEVTNMLYEMQDKLAYKEYLAAKLYYNLGPYMGNNYRSCVVTAKQAIEDYPYSKYKDDLVFIMLKAKYQEALYSRQDKMQERYRDVVDQYYTYINGFPKGKYVKEAQKLYDDTKKRIVKVD